MELRNFKVKKYLYKPNQYFIWYQIIPKNNRHVITKIKNINGIDNVIKILKHLKQNKNIKFNKEHLVTWLDYK